MDPNVGSTDVWPRICAYNKDRLAKTQVDRGKHSVTFVREQVERRSLSSIVWNPYDRSKYIMEEDLREAFILSLKRVVFFDPESNKGVLYLGDRCWRQLMNQVAIPPDPPAKASISNIPLSVYEAFK